MKDEEPKKPPLRPENANYEHTKSEIEALRALLGKKKAESTDNDEQRKKHKE